MSKPTDDKTLLKGRGHVTSRDPFQFFVTPIISVEWLMLELSNFVHSYVKS